MKSSIGLILIAALFAGCAAKHENKTLPGVIAPERDPRMQLGAFSISLAVKDLAASRAFYEKLGFRQMGGDGKRYLMMQNDTATIGLFQGFFDKNSLTFNPGIDRSAAALDTFQDVRDIQKELKARGLTLGMEADPNSTGTAYITLTDPDGNPILIDQHVPRPGK